MMSEKIQIQSETKETLERSLKSAAGAPLAATISQAINLICQAGHPDPRLGAETEIQVLQDLIESLCNLSMHDGLTGLTNKRYFQMALKRELQRAARNDEHCILLMMDVDHFKEVNDQHGHPAGDLVLQVVSKRLKTELRPGDILSRFGGEEFSAILPNCPLHYAVHVAERLRRSIAEKNISIDKQTEIPVTLSIGVAAQKISMLTDPDSLLKAADKNLYRAKTNGRNQCFSESDIPAEVSAEEKGLLFNHTRTHRN